MSGAGDAPGEHMRDRADQSRVKLWVLLEADRWLVTASLFVLVFGILVAVGFLSPSAEQAIRGGDSVDTLFQALVAATITGVTLVLTLNQLVLSQELGPAGDQRQRMTGAMAFREDVADVIQAPVSPARPTQFLRALVERSGDAAAELRASLPGDADGEGDEEGEAIAAIRELTDSVVTDAATVSKGLDGARFGTFDVISSALNFNYSWKLYSSRKLREQYGERLDDEGRDALEQLIDTLELFGPAREHFKTLYFQWALVDLSRHIIVASIPALLVSASMIVFFDASSYSVVLFDVETLVVVIAAATAITLLPFLILLAYIVRIATVAKRTLSIGPFILRETEDAGEVEWEG